MPAISEALHSQLSNTSNAPPRANGNPLPSTGIHSVDGSTTPDQLDRIREGDERALSDLIRDFSPLVYGVALRITGNEADAADVLQDVFVGLPEALGRFDGRNLAGWLKVVTTRRALMLLRSERRQRKYAAAASRSARQHPEDQTLTRIMLDDALDRIASNLRTVFVLKEMQGFTHPEIADALGISVNVSQVRLYRARCALRKLLA